MARRPELDELDDELEDTFERERDVRTDREQAEEIEAMIEDEDERDPLP